MAVISITEPKLGRQGGQNRLWQRAYTRTLQITTDDPEDDSVVVLSALPVAIGQAYSTTTGTDIGSFVTDIRVRCTADDAMGWEATIEYGPYDATQAPQNPLDQQPDIAWEGQPYQKPADVDNEGEPCLNSADDPFDPPLMRDHVMPILRITRNEATYDPLLAYSINGSVNSNSFFGADPGVVKVQTPPAARVYSPEIPGYFWVVQYEFAFNDEKWLTKVLDRGMRQIDPSDDTKQIDITKNGVAISTPALLDGNGQPLPWGLIPSSLSSSSTRSSTSPSSGSIRSIRISPMADKTYGINAQSAKRIAKVVRYVERIDKNEPITRSRGPANTNPGVKIAITNETITALSGNRPGKGKVTLQYYEGPDHDIDASDVIVTVSNIAGSIPSGKKIYVAYGDGGWHVVVYPCP